MIIYMDDYRKDEDSQTAESSRYEQERMRANGAPALQLAMTEAALAAPLPTPELPDDFEDFDAKDFIDRAHALASQI